MSQSVIFMSVCNSRCVEARSPLDFGNVLINVGLLIILVLWLRKYQNDLINVKHIKTLALLAALCVFSTFVIPLAINLKFDTPQNPHLKKFLRTQ